MRKHGYAVPDKDASQEALEKVETATESDPVNGEDLLGSEELKRQLRQAKERLKQEPGHAQGH